MVSRRQFLRGDFKTRSQTPQRPPWARPEVIFGVECSGCRECVKICPTKIIVQTGRYPEVDFTRGECTFCGACEAVCRDGALRRDACPEGPWTIKAQIAETCLAKKGVECRVCGDRCPVTAIRFSPRLGGPPLAEVDTASCTGCGACVAPCPVAAISVR